MGYTFLYSAAKGPHGLIPAAPTDSLTMAALYRHAWRVSSVRALSTLAGTGTVPVFAYAAPAALEALMGRP